MIIVAWKAINSSFFTIFAASIEEAIWVRVVTQCALYEAFDS
jgi:hypothetical protein